MHQSDYQKPQLTAKELSEIFLNCITAIRKKDIIEDGLDLHWTNIEKRQILLNFVANKRVLQILYDVMSQGQNTLVTSSSVLNPS